MSSELAKILLVEDNLADARLTREALVDGKVRVDLFHVEDGVEAMAFLRKEGDYSDSPTPDLILLDLNLPRKGGREVLEEIKSSQELSLIPVVVLTTSQSEEDIIKSYEMKANCYITKPVGFEDFTKVIKTIDEFWFSIVKLPK